MTNWVFKYCINGGENYQSVDETFNLTYELLADKEKQFSKYLDRINYKNTAGSNLNGKKNYIINFSIEESPKKKNILHIKYEKCNKFKIFLKYSSNQDTENFNPINDYIELQDRNLRILLPSYFE